jgi:hypothetical protein
MFRRVFLGARAEVDRVTQESGTSAPYRTPRRAVAPSPRDPWP